MAPQETSIIGYYYARVREFILRFDFMQLFPLITLLSIGVLFIYGTGQQIGISRYETAYQKQIQWIILGMAVWTTLSLIDYRKLTFFVWPIYGFSLFLLTLVLFLGEERFGAKRWLSIAGLSFQPSELAKLATLLAIAWILSRRGFSINHIPSLLLVSAVTGLQFMLILIEPDLGSSLVLITLFCFLVFAAGLSQWFW